METKQAEWQDFTVSADRNAYPDPVIIEEGVVYEPALPNSFITHGALVETRRVGPDTIRVRRVLSDKHGVRTYGGEETWIA